MKMFNYFKNKALSKKIKTATNQEEFEKLLKEGKEFQLKASSGIFIASIDGTEAVLKVNGKAKEDTNELYALLNYAIYKTAVNRYKKGVPRDKVTGEIAALCVSMIDSVCKEINELEYKEKTDENES